MYVIMYAIMLYIVAVVLAVMTTVVTHNACILVAVCSNVLAIYCFHILVVVETM